MAIVTATLTVNAAFFKEVKEDNVQLGSLLKQAETLLSAPGINIRCGDQAVQLLVRLHDQLVLHFTLEEAYGYFQDPLEVAPRLHDKAEMLRAEHGRLDADLTHTIEEAELQLDGKMSTTLSEQLFKMFDDFVARLREHERAENFLILQAFDDDVGVGD